MPLAGPSGCRTTELFCLPSPSQKQTRLGGTVGREKIFCSCKIVCVKKMKRVFGKLFKIISS